MIASPMWSKVIEQVRRFFGVLPISYELSGGRIIIRCGSSTRELARLSEIASWRVLDSKSDTLTIYLGCGNRSIVVRDPRGALRELLQQVAGDGTEQG